MLLCHVVDIPSFVTSEVCTRDPETRPRIRSTLARALCHRCSFSFESRMAPDFLWISLSPLPPSNRSLSAAVIGHRQIYIEGAGKIFSLISSQQVFHSPLSLSLGPELIRIEQKM